MIQDVRGRYASEGEFYPLIHETHDGLDTFAWAASQLWSSEIVGPSGDYLGATQWLPARESPSALRAMVPSVTFSDMCAGCVYQGGAKVLHDLRWVVEDIISAEMRRRGVQVDGRLDLESALAEIPLASHPLIRQYALSYLDWLSHRTAVNRVFHDAARPSRLILPIIRRR